MAQALPEFKTRVARWVLIPSRGGCFELTVGGTLIYSKLQTGEFPDVAEMLKTIEAALGDGS